MPCNQPDPLPNKLSRELSAWPTIQAIAPDGSDRRFFRLRRGSVSCICLYHPRPPGGVVTENDSYYLIGRHLRQQGLPVPQILTYCREEGWLLLEDLGDTSLQEEYLANADRHAALSWYRQALALLLDLQRTGTQSFDPAWCFDTPVYDAELVYSRECQYFQEAFLQGYLGWQYIPADLEQDFTLLLARALQSGRQVFLHRDFQSRNLLVHQGCLWLIDFQGARLGPPQYDLAALLLDPYVQLPPEFQENLLDEYLLLQEHYLRAERLAWRQQYWYVALCRNLQILGAYGFLSRQKGKPFFQQFIPAACQSLIWLLEQVPSEELPTLRQIAHRSLKQVVSQLV